MSETLELENQDAADENQEELETEVEEGDESEGHESSSDEEADLDKTAETETSSEKTEKTDQEKIDYSFKKKQFELQAARRATATSEAALKEAQDKIAELTKTKRPDVPDMPDTFDDAYDAKMAVRDEALRAQERFDQEKAFNLQKQQASLQQQQQTRHQNIQLSQKKYTERAEELKIDPQLLLSMENEVSSFITPQNAGTAEYLLNHADGPLLVQHLYANPSELEKIATMSAIDAAVHIATVIAPAAQKSIIKPTKKPPAPHETFEGKGKTKAQDPALDGAIFD